jgi:hypothetical protein
MAYLAVNKNGSEMICQNEPERVPLNKKKVYDKTKYRYVYVNPVEIWEDCEIIGMGAAYAYYDIPLPEGTIEKLIGRKLTWEDDPVEF